MWDLMEMHANGDDETERDWHVLKAQYLLGKLIFRQFMENVCHENPE